MKIRRKFMFQGLENAFRAVSALLMPPPAATNQAQRPANRICHLAFVSTDLELNAVPKPENRTANAFVWFPGLQNVFRAISALLVFLAPVPEPKSSSRGLRPTPKALNLELNAVPTPQNPATHKLLESESCVPCPAGHGQPMYIQLCRLFCYYNVSPATAILGP